MAFGGLRHQHVSRIGCIVVTLALTHTLIGAEQESRSWRFENASSDSVRMVSHDRDTGQDGEVFERLHLDSVTDFGQVTITHRDPPARPVNEFRASMRCRSNRSGLHFALRLIFPHQQDPRTNQPLITYLPGDVYDAVDQWQKLTATVTNEQIVSQVQRLRTELHRTDLNLNGVYITGCVLTGDVSRGDVFIDITETEYGPVLPVPKQDLLIGDGWLKDEVAQTRPVNQVTIERSQVIVNKKPVLFRLIPEHGEPADMLAGTGANAVWVRDYLDVDRLQDLADHGLTIVATPPFPQFDPQNFETPLVGLSPLEQVCPQASMFYLGTRVTRKQMPYLSGCAREIRSADRILRRPLIADVATGEDVASRKIDLVGIGQPVIGRTSSSFGEVRNRILRRQQTSSQLTLPWTWLHTEPSGAMSNWRSRLGYQQHIVEPEQLLIQMITAVSGGCRGVGFWKTDPLVTEGEDASELALTIELASLYLDILEPFLVNGRVERHLTISTDSAGNQVRSQSGGRMGLAALNSSPVSMNVDFEESPSAPDAAVIQSEGRSIIVAAFWDDSSQFVAQPMYSRSARLVVPANQTASAWRLRATTVEGLPREVTAGGLNLNVKDFDQFAIFLVTSNPNDARQLQHRLHQRAERAAWLQLKIAQSKYARTQAVCGEVDEYVSHKPVSSAVYSSIQRLLNQAESSFKRGDYSVTEALSSQAGRMLREIQNHYWQAAIKNLSGPSASPHTVCFSSLPDHWQMLTKCSQQPDSNDLLQSGSFENLRLIEDAGWIAPEPPERFAYQTSADVKTDERRNGAYLRMTAWKPSSKQDSPQQTALLVNGPDIQSATGDVFEIRGKVRLGGSVVPEDAHPLMIFDEELGPEHAVRPQLEPSWREFRMFRQMSRNGVFQLRLALNGAAEVHVDDVSVRRIGNVRPVSRIRLTGHTVPAEGQTERQRSRIQDTSPENSSLP